MSMKDKFKNFFNMEEEYEYVEEYTEDPSTQAQPSTKKEKGKNVVNLSAIQQPVSKVMLCEPTSYNEVQEIADNLLNKRAVVINMQRVDHSQAKRIVDFLSGTVYAVKGDIQKLGAGTFLCTPDNIDVSGTISELNMEEADF
ncbi:MAG TPA: cell division protein SepF [Pseudogracilibacillus sp.]|nr:cell division protein SepF [Pseudogracilibacillus sp.]